MSENATPATEFAPCHHLTQPCQCDLQKTRNRTRLKCCACHEKWRWTRPKCCACHENCNTSSENVTKVLRLPRKNDFQHVAKHVWMSRSATPATRNEATTRLKPPKMTTSAELPIGTAIRGSRGRLRTVADAEATSSEHTLNPQTPRVKLNPCYAFGKKVDVITPINILLIGGGEFWSLMKKKVMLLPPINILFLGGDEFWSLMNKKWMLLLQSTYCS